MKILELFSGVGGWRYALGERVSRAFPYDISPLANATYFLNHGTRPHAKELASVAPTRLLDHGADIWALSPPCQPFCRMGKGEGLEDPRSRAYLAFLQLLDMAPPGHLLLENVTGFLGSEAFGMLAERLERHSYRWHAWTLCPTQFGIPNQRPRCYVVASRQSLSMEEPPSQVPDSLRPWLDEEEDPSLYLTDAVLAKHKPGLDLVRADGNRTACFIGGYGQRFVGSGSFLITERGIRRFSTAEVARLLGYPATFRFPDSVPLQARYKLLGNGLSLPVAQWIAARLPY